MSAGTTVGWMLLLIAGVTEAAEQHSLDSTNTQVSFVVQHLGGSESLQTQGAFLLFVVSSFRKRHQQRGHTCTHDVETGVISSLADRHRRAAQLIAKITHASDNAQLWLTTSQRAEPRPCIVRKKRSGDDLHLDLRIIFKTAQSVDSRSE